MSKSYQLTKKVHFWKGHIQAIYIYITSTTEIKIPLQQLSFRQPFCIQIFSLDFAKVILSIDQQKQPKLVDKFIQLQLDLVKSFHSTG